MDHNWLFLDMNSFFASIEQQEQPLLRGRPVAVAPMLSDATCVIAASYAAKPYGVKTGVNVADARKMCPELTVVEARPQLYIHYHQKLIDTIRQELPDPKTLSVDEIACRLWSNERTGAEAVRIGRHLKNEVRKHLGSEMYSSVGIAPNIFLAKVASDMLKPNGLTILKRTDLPDALKELQIRDLPGIGRKMHVKLHAAGIHTISQLYAASEFELGAVWGGIVGRRWWYMLRGSEDADYSGTVEPIPQAVSNSHVIEPALRTVAGAEALLLRLLAKAASRMRNKGYSARRLSISVAFQSDQLRKESWRKESGRVEPADDLITWLPLFRAMWKRRPSLGFDLIPKRVCVTFYDLISSHDKCASLFKQESKLSGLSELIEEINNRFRRSNGRHNTVDLASVYWLNNHAPERIAFRKISDDDRERDGFAA